MIANASPTTLSAGDYERTRSRLGHRGFTLIELLVVVSIIALLIAILLPSLRRARDQAKALKCQANLRSIALALFSYSDDNRQELPDYDGVGRYSFRIAPGTRQTTELRSGEPTGYSLYPEIFGIQAVLHTGAGISTERAPQFKNRPVYLAGDSEVYVCPSNPGPKSPAPFKAVWNSLGNTYDFRVVRDTSNKGLMNIDRLRNKRDTGHHEILLAWDNTDRINGRPGFIGPYTGGGYNVNRDDRVPPHRRMGGASDGPPELRAMTSSQAAYLDGHVDWRPNPRDDDQDD